MASRIVMLVVCATALATALAATALPIAAAEEISSPLRVAQCRANCLQKFASSGPDRGSMCLQGPDCFMCWENCELLQANFAVWGAMCAEKGICFPGCQQACRFHRETAKVHQSEPVIHTRGDEVVRMDASTASWPRVASTDAATPLVYVVVARLPGTTQWKQLVQTVDLSARLPEPNLAIRVLVVDPEGLVTIYSPVPVRAPGPISTAGFEPLGLGKTMLGQRKKINTEIQPTTPRSATTVHHAVDWKLRQVSLIHQKVLVIAEVAWQPRATRAVYLVTWEVDGGGLKGNLFTDSTSVTLSLWPDTVYHIQVELVSRTPANQSQRSASLMIDTHRAEQVAIEATFLAAAALDRRPKSTPTPTPAHSEIEFAGFLPSEAVVEHPRPKVTRDKPVSSTHPAMSSPLLSVLVKRSDIADVADQTFQTQLMAGAGAALLFFVVAVVLMVWRCHNEGLGSARVGDTSIRPKKLVEEVCHKPIVRESVATVDVVDVHRCQREATSQFLQAAERCARNEVQV